ncbi:MAG TPA: GAF domain-containing SpoIIE family protein phosphatase, partial [Acidimicrobiales bacterium]|nr:GAF domain-containing SpoIIE family protein phosphatase [Acidimicrobiales bacterium]
CVRVEAADPALTARLAGALRGDGWLDELHADDRPRAADQLATVLAGGPAGDEPVRLAGGDRWAILRIAAVDTDPDTDNGAGTDTGTGAGPAVDTATAGGPVVLGATGVLVDATRSLGVTARMARLVEGFNRLRRPAEIVRAMLGEGVDLVGASSATLHLLSDAGDELVVAGSVGLPTDVLEERYGRIPLGSSLPAAEVMRIGRMIMVSSEAERRDRYPELEHRAIAIDPAFAVVPLIDAEGRPFGAMAVGFPHEVAFGPADRDFLEDVAAQCAIALDRARLADAAERAQENLGFLAGLSAALSSSLDIDTALNQLAGLTVPRIADWCVVRLLETTAQPRPPVGAAHVDGAQVPHLTRLVQRIPRDLIRTGPLGEALADGRPLIRGAAAAGMLESLFDDARDRAAVDAVGVDSVAIFPLQARGRLLGALAFGNRPGRSFDDAELSLARAVATRSAIIVDNVRLFHEQYRVARALQDSLLPGSLPKIPGIGLGARYLAAGGGFDVGGDFYDAFQADANWWIVAVGDVCGHGVEAAATTGLVRHTIRSAAMGGVMPSAVLTHLNEMLLRNSAERDVVDGDLVPVSPPFCTVLVGAVQPTARGVDIILCSGGHPLPLVGRATGDVEPVGQPGTLLGVTEELSLSDTVVHLDPGESLVCYTDGLTDRRAGRRAFGEEGVVKAFYQAARLPANEMATAIVAEAVGFVDEEPVDDMAVLALRALDPEP